MTGDVRPHPTLAEADAWGTRHVDLLASCFERFRQTGEWPTLEQLQHQFEIAGRDEDVSRLAFAMPRLLGFVEQQRMVLLIRALAYVPKRPPCLTTGPRSSSSPTASGAMIRRLNWHAPMSFKHLRETLNERGLYLALYSGRAGHLGLATGDPTTNGHGKSSRRSVTLGMPRDRPTSSRREIESSCRRHLLPRPKSPQPSSRPLQAPSSGSGAWSVKIRSLPLWLAASWFCSLAPTSFTQPAKRTLLKAGEGGPRLTSRRAGSSLALPRLKLDGSRRAPAALALLPNPLAQSKVHE